MKEVQDAEISELEINILHSALLSIIPDMQTQIDFLRERLENVEAYLRGNAQE